MNWKDAVLAYPTKCSLEISERYALFPEDESPSLGAAWPDQYPNSEGRGVYLILSKAEVPLYIGKAVKQRLGNRLGVYFGTDRKTKGCLVRHPIAVGKGWSERPTYIVTVAVPNDLGDEATRLETYLIEKLQPSDNIVGILRDKEAA
jgi:excinuclease UvrABC nuclease subunit